ncbi:hypothetical protein L1987_15618 [Smallanthus sonchifolius]|uniref:Uncharacterized protein n=1 Tax=Smallanthus sonchifolius TaxID=185202 RepID=A0ACB9J5Z8_9ASTR|nr:hypothetical protein L1987_15618 [Smallanthus sonchifolius]
MPAPDLGEKQEKNPLDREIRGMMSILTSRLAHLTKKTTEGGSGSNMFDNDDHDDDHGGFGIITMAGSNEGATMTGEMSMEDHKSGMKERDEHVNSPLTTFLNSNFQGVNNSIMVGGSYSANDPGIHLDVEDYEQLPAHPRHGQKGKKKAHFGTSKRDDSS